MHPVYGGWFAFRSVIVLPGLELPSLTYSQFQGSLMCGWHFGVFSKFIYSETFHLQVIIIIITNYYN